MTDRVPVILTAFMLDIILGDPHWLPHPVRWIGRAVHFIETGLRKTGLPLRLSAVLLTFIVVSTTLALSLSAILLAYRFSDPAGFIISVIIMYTTLSTRSLYDEGMKVYKDLRNNNLIAARNNLSMIVGRDTDHLDSGEVIRGAVETIAENSVDGVISPLFYAMIGGPALAIAYKSINTLDSMVGYKNEKYIDLGWASARLDDLANYIPARISGFLIPAAALLCGKGLRNSLRTVLHDRKNHPSPNSGIPEAAVAGALGVQLGGVNYYQGVPSSRPFIGELRHNFSEGHITGANRIMIVSSILMLLTGSIILLVLSAMT
ncbi:MAG: cobalamin biosynthesis protein CobD [Nitrospirae bacterium]|nr:cobalamin biosynthesis protein CobD [Nitrospirota bacterium]